MDHDAPLDPGTLELYVLGALPPAEMIRVQVIVENDPALRRKVDDMQHALEALAWAGSVAPPADLREAVLGQALRASGERTPMCVINERTRIKDLPRWIFNVSDPDPASYTNMHVEYLDCPPELASGLVWVHHHVPEEEHTDVIESFLILEGTCEVLIGDGLRSMGPGESVVIPLHTPHSVHVTSSFPCKAVVQRRPLVQ